MSIGWGVIGAGKIAENRTIPEGILASREAKLVALMRRDADRAHGLADKFHCEAYTDEEALLGRSDIDAVYIASPTCFHHPHTIKALAAGKHVLCEKPMAMDLQEAEAMAAKAADANRALALGFMMRFHPVHRKMKKLIDQQRLGRLVSAHAQFSCWYPDTPGAWRQRRALGGGGVVADMAIHVIDLLGMFMGRITSVSAQLSTLSNRYEVEDSSAILLRFESGAFATINSHFNLPTAVGPSELVIYGVQGSIEARGTLGQRSEGAATVRLLADTGQNGSSESKIVTEEVNMYRAQIEDLHGAIQTGQTPLNSAALGVESQRVLDAVYRSAQEDRTIPLAARGQH